MGRIKVIKQKNLPTRSPLFPFLATMAFILAAGVPMSTWYYWLLYGGFGLWTLIYFVEKLIQKEVNVFKYIDRGLEEKGMINLDLDDIGPKKPFKQQLRELNQKLQDKIRGKRLLTIVEIGSGKFQLDFQGKVKLELTRSDKDYFHDTFKKAGFEVLEARTELQKEYLSKQ